MPSVTEINAVSSFSAKSHTSGIGGIFWNYSGNILFHFSKEIIVGSAILTEILAHKEGLLIMATSRWLSASPFYLEYDSTDIVVWFNDISQTPWRFKKIIRGNIQHFDCHITWSRSYIREYQTKQLVFSHVLELMDLVSSN